MVEVSANEITLRVGPRWLRFTPRTVGTDEAPATPFDLNEDGTVTLGSGPSEEMDVAAERFARELLA